jgi:hypothetical protein
MVLERQSNNLLWTILTILAQALVEKLYGIFKPFYSLVDLLVGAANVGLELFDSEPDRRAAHLGAWSNHSETEPGEILRSGDTAVVLFAQVDRAPPGRRMNGFDRYN